MPRCGRGNLSFLLPGRTSAGADPSGHTQVQSYPCNSRNSFDSLLKILFYYLISLLDHYPQHPNKNPGSAIGHLDPL